LRKLVRINAQKKVRGYFNAFDKLSQRKHHGKNTPLAPGSQAEISLPKFSPVIQPKGGVTMKKGSWSGGSFIDLVASFTQNLKR
jgi:hypothetical protein